MVVEARMLSTPSRTAIALVSQPEVRPIPEPASDDDTISENSFESSTDHFSFTPKQTSKLPRAWERKPSTPFAPRTETQKIWKRVPLQDKTNTDAVEIRANSKDEANARGVKRARLTVPGPGSGKDNYANTLWDKQVDEARRKVPKEKKTVLQSTRNSLSPLRRDITLELLNEPLPPSPLALETVRVIKRLEEMQEDDERREREKNKPEATAIIADMQREESHAEHSHQEDQILDPSLWLDFTSTEQALTPIKDNSNRDETAGVTPGPSSFFTDSIIFDDQDDFSDIPFTSLLESTFVDVKETSMESGRLPEQALAVDSTPQSATTSPEQSSAEVEILQASPGSSFSHISESNLPSSKNSTDIPQAKCVEPMTSDKEQPSLQIFGGALDIVVPAEETSDQSEPTGELLQASSTGAVETSIDFNDVSSKLLSAPETDPQYKDVTPDVICSLQTPVLPCEFEDSTIGAKENDILAFGSSCNTLNNQLFTPQAPNLAAPEAPPSDDTAYLHDFLTRARAQRAARAANSPEKTVTTSGSPSKNTRQALANLSANSTSPTKTPQAELKAGERFEEEVDDEQATSPCRRSSRPRISKQPKSVIPTIPNTIPVRRSNGTEFVFLQRTEAMQVALATRNNTKRNKGEAVPPTARLEILASGEMSPVKGRKKTTKSKKIVTWNEKLTQELKAAEWEDVAEFSEKPELPPAPTVEANSILGESEKTEKREKKKVKRLGTVNGTPAPKKAMVATATALPVPTRNLRARIPKTS